MKIMGLDLSTSCSGVTILDDDFNIVLMTHIDFGKCNGFWEKVDHACAELLEIIRKYGPEKFFVEEPVLGYSTGQSSAGTITLLMKFNYIVSFYVRSILHVDPVHIEANAARRSCGVKLVSKAKSGGRSYKEQAFDFMKAGLLKDVEFPMTKTGKFKPYCYDRVDSYVIARAGLLSIVK